MKEELIIPKPGGLSYGSYLKVNPLLNLQEPVAKPEQHDEMLFIIIHQVYELWFKLMLHEAGMAIQQIREDKPLVCNKVLRRIVSITNTLVGQVDVIETMTPIEFNTYRSMLNPASGFQSAQFRIMEFTMGSKNANYMKFYQDDDPLKKDLVAAYENPSLWDEVLAFLDRKGLRIPVELLKRDWKQPYQANDAVTQEIVKVYKSPAEFFDVYQLLESLIDFDERIGIWRYRHVLMVERMIGSLQGTGGSSGVGYLSSTLSKRFFPELWMARNFLMA